MITEYLELSIVRTEGIEISKAACYISVNDHLQKVISPLSLENETNSIEITSVGLLRVLVKSLVTHECLGSVSIKLELLPKEGLQWLPLYRGYKDTVNKLPEEVESPKILLFINSNSKDDTSFLCHISSLSPVIELTESSEGEAEIEEILYLSQKNNFEIDIKTEFTKEKSIMIEKKVKDQLNFEKETESLRKENDELEAQLTSLIKEQEIKSRQHKNSEISMLQLLESKDKEISKLNSQLTALKLANMSLENEKKQQAHIISQQITKHSAKKMDLFTKEIEKLKISLNKSETQKNDLQSLLQNLRSSENSFTQEKLKKTLLETLDDKVTAYLKNCRLDMYFTKQPEISYLFKGKRVYLTYQNSSFFCREAENVYNLDDMVKTCLDGSFTDRVLNSISGTSLNSPVQTIHRRLNSNSVILENEKSFENMNKSYCDKTSMHRSKSSRGHLQNAPILNQYRSKSPIITPLKESKQLFRMPLKSSSKPPFK